MKFTLFATVAALALTATPSFAQDAAATDDSEAPGEIVVTAQKRSERLQDVPVAVSVVSGNVLEAQGGANIENAQYLVPTLNFRKSGTTINQSLFLRGVGTSTFSIAGEPSVSTVLDGVVYSRAGEAFGDLVDIERIEVLRGPQGTLFGKNASAGVVNIVSRAPTDKFEGSVEASYFSKSEFRGRVVLNLPLGEKVASRITGFYGDYNGNITNLAIGKKVNGYKHYGARATIKAEPTDTLTLTLIGDYRRSKDNCCAEVIGTQPTGLGALALSGIQFKGDKTRTIKQNLVTRTNERSTGVSLQADLELGDHVLTSITAYRDYKNTEIRDGDFVDQAYVGLNQLHDVGPQSGNTFTQEVRLTSPGKQFIDYVVGAFYSRAETERTFTRNDIVCNTTPTPTTLIPCTAVGAPASTFPSGTATFGSVFKNFALFSQATVNFADGFRGIAGLRYTHDSLDVFHSRTTTLAGPGIQPSFGPFATGTSKNNLSGKAGLQVDLSENSMLYGTYARGYKGPAFNVFFNLTATGTNVIEAETANSFEVGLKNTLLGGRLVLNLAGYYAKYKNFQANNPDIVAGVVVTRFTNAGTVSTRGFEADFVYRPVRDLNLSGGIAYTDAQVDQFRVPVGGNPAAVIPSGTPLAYAPKFKGSLAADYRWRTGGPVDAIFGIQTSYQSKQLSLFDANAANRAAGTIDAYGLVDLSVAILDPDDRYKLTLQVKNLFDKSFAAAITNGGPGGSFRYQIPREADRYFGATFRVNF
jgi:iron complex outermembrane receptor protein